MTSGAHVGPVQHLLETYPRPIHVATGDRNPFFDVDHATRQATRARDSHLTVIPRTWHYPSWKHPPSG